ncbi:unnamed protein product [Nyctereutes procyonoides]|uniref:(raccoon dog) hypothetical protein n=1 Tax=Nyctereutes procyonoides TaxID=34880 RepID=A0A811XXN1_NYCPR|nr:unnamed protein product [Nyctereutes procyonoides]
MNDNNDIEVESYEVQPRFPSATDTHSHHNARHKNRAYTEDSLHSAQAHILDRSTDYIQCLQRKKHTHQQDIDDLKGKNALLQQRVHSLEKARSSVQLPTNYPSLDNGVYTNAKGSTISSFERLRLYKDGESVSPVVVTWCILAEHRRHTLGWMFVMAGSHSRLLEMETGSPALHYPFPSSLSGASRPGKDLLGPGPVRKESHHWWNSTSISLAHYQVL